MVDSEYGGHFASIFVPPPVIISTITSVGAWGGAGGSGGAGGIVAQPRVLFGDKATSRARVLYSKPLGAGLEGICGAPLHVCIKVGGVCPSEEKTAHAAG